MTTIHCRSTVNKLFTRSLCNLHERKAFISFQIFSRLQLFPHLVANLIIFEDNSKLGRECSLEELSLESQPAATTRREAVFSDRIDRRDSREFLKVTRAFPLPRVSRNVSHFVFHDTKKKKKLGQLREVIHSKA